jgi:hypothetical protein
VLLQRNDGPITVIAMDGASKPVVTSRIPAGRRVIAAGDVPFAFVAVIDRAIMSDLTRSSYAIDHDRRSSPSTGWRSSRGRSLAMLGGDRDIIITPLARTSYRRLSTTHFVRGPLRWAPDGTLFAVSGGGHVRWNLDGTVEARTERALGFTSTGAPITLSRDSRIVIERGLSEQSYAIDRSFGVTSADVTDRHLMVRGIKRVEVYALSSADARPVRRTRDRSFLRDAVLVGEANVMYLDDPHAYLPMRRETMSPSLPRADARQSRRTRVAIATGIPSRSGRARSAPSNSPRARRDHRLVTDLRTLAVSTRDGIELWTIYRRAAMNARLGPQRSN